ncbi:MAG: hypothetical protein A2166_06485 [Omnitrophica WOR_2 bacterium RBG_13_41_10]|nr:MAG: hypothetical protein A2166_06485 [Omnitrophica WOR_2 bacterium RBG_13_41_10]
MSIKEILDIILSIFNIRSMKIISRQKIILAVILLTGLSLLLYQSLLSMQLVKVKALEFNLLSQKKLANYQHLILKEPKLLTDKIEIMKDRLHHLEQNFILAEETTKFFDDIKGLVSITDNRLVSLDKKPALPFGIYKKVPFVISASGYYTDIVLFINKLEHYPRLIDTRDIKIEAIETQKRTCELVMELKAEVFLK